MQENSTNLEFYLAQQQNYTSGVKKYILQLKLPLLKSVQHPTPFYFIDMLKFQCASLILSLVY